ncbi:hypothetical protein VN97_g12506 [Penicillium thymicola]|uniref:Uncharacterized protein n=1 Tax=Penicillium thymicola TaxID=293382 RepID=A0AAI9T599_PENTH|nr:hypothetical protein VN97_g12506 [Penicillium thymicola]
MLSELIVVPEPSAFIAIKDNGLSAVEKPVQTITIIDFCRYSTAILDFDKSSNAGSLALSAFNERIPILQPFYLANRLPIPTTIHLNGARMSLRKVYLLKSMLGNGWLTNQRNATTGIALTVEKAAMV